MKNVKVIGVLLVAGFVLVGCGNNNQAKDTSSKEQTSISQKDTSKKAKSSSVNSDSSSEANDASTSSEQSSVSSEAGTSSVVSQENPTPEANFSNAQEAAIYLIKQLGLNDEIAGGGEDKTQTDDKGTYYEIRLVNTKWREDGGSGTVGNYKVYLDGTYGESLPE